MTGTVISADGTAIASTTTGEGPAVIVVDGALCHRSFGPSGGIAEQSGSQPVAVGPAVVTP